MYNRDFTLKVDQIIKYLITSIPLRKLLHQNVIRIRLPKSLTQNINKSNKHKAFCVSAYLHLFNACIINSLNINTPNMFKFIILKKRHPSDPSNKM